MNYNSKIKFFGVNCYKMVQFYQTFRLTNDEECEGTLPFFLSYINFLTEYNAKIIII